MNISRRSFMSVAALPLVRGVEAFPPVCLFSKPLQFMDWKQLAKTVKQLGFAGVDLTVRPKGHVLPENVREDLPKAAEIIRGEGLDLPMISTELLSTRDPAAASTLTAAGRLGISYCKPGYYKYEFADVRAELKAAAADFHGLAALAQANRVHLGYHNHTGNIGGPVWDIDEMLVGLDSKWAGFYFDPAHAVAEGGGAGWKVALNRVAPRIFMTAIKDFTWERAADGTWRERWCPLGEGMVDWKLYFHELRRVDFRGPISLHIEYATGEEQVTAAARHDLEFLWKVMRQA